MKPTPIVCAAAALIALPLSAAHAQSRASFQGIGMFRTASPGSQAWGISADGKTIVGQSVSDPGPQAFRWTAGDGMVGLGDLSGGPFASLASAANADGSVIVGFGKSAASGTNYEAFRWSAGRR